MGGVASATTLIVLGSTIVCVGAGIGVPRVFSEPDPATKLHMLEDRLVLWRVAQPFYAVGPLVAASGVGFLAASVDDGSERAPLLLSCLLLLARIHRRDSVDELRSAGRCVRGVVHGGAAGRAG